MPRNILIGVVVVIVLFSFAFLLVNMGIVKPTKTLSGLELAEKMLAFTEAQKLSDNIYKQDLLCTSNERCKAEDKARSAGSLLTIAYLRLYQATGKSEYLDIAKDDITKMIASCSKGGNESECFHYTLVLSLFYEKITDENYKGLAIVLRPVVEATIEKGHGGDAFRQFLLAGHLLDYYALVAEERYRMLALEHYDLGKKAATGAKVYYEEPEKGVVLRNVDCQELLTTSDFYRILKDENYRLHADKLIEETNLPQTYQHLKTSTDAARCAEGYLALFELTGEKRYQEEAIKIMQYIVTTFMDTPFNKLYTGDFGVVQFRGPVSNRKILPVNFWILSNFTRLNNISFQMK